MVAVPADKIDRIFGKPCGKVFLVIGCYGVYFHFSVPPELQWKLPPVFGVFGMFGPHIIGVHDSDGFIEPAVVWTRFVMIPQVPFPKESGRIAIPLKHLCHGCKIRIQSALPWSMSPEEAISFRIGTGHQCTPGG